MAKKRTFKTIEEVIEAYWPDQLKLNNDQTEIDPAKAGEELGRRVVEDFGRQLTARLQRTK